MDNVDATTKFYVFLCDVDNEAPDFVYMLRDGVWYRYGMETDTYSVHPEHGEMYRRLAEGIIVEVKCE